MADEANELALPETAPAPKRKFKPKTKPKTKTAVPSVPKEPPRDYDMITYLPGKDGRNHTETHGIAFEANVPKKVLRSQTTSQLVKRESTTVEGTIVTRHVEQRIRIVDALRTNPWFSINGEKAPEPVKGKSRLPDNPDQYRGYANQWIRECTTLRELEARWEGEDWLREKCGVSDEELRAISPFYEMMQLQLKDKAAEDAA